MATERQPQQHGRVKASPAKIAKALRGVDFPRTKAGILDYARQRTGGRKHDIMDVLDRLPERNYGSMADVAKGVGEVG